MLFISLIINKVERRHNKLFHVICALSETKGMITIMINNKMIEELADGEKLIKCNCSEP